jgi:DNA-directed RNA polymerase specialized sigma24 family protein
VAGGEIPVELLPSSTVMMPNVAPELLPALRRLPMAQRTAVLLVHGYGWRLREVAELPEVTASTVHQNLTRELDQLRAELEVRDVS